MAKNTIVKGIETMILKLKSAQEEIELEMAQPTPSGNTDTTITTSGSTLPSVLVEEIIPKKTTVAYSAVGAPVMVTDAKGKESVASDGQIETTLKIITIEKGKLLKIEDRPTEAPSGNTTGDTTQLSKVIIPVIELAKTDKYPFDQCLADNTAKYGVEGAKKVCGAIKAKVGMSKEEVQPILEMSKTPEEFETKLNDLDLKMQQSTADAVKNALTRAGLDISKAGSYCLNFTIGDDGSMSYGTLATNTYQDLLLSKEKEIQLEVDGKVKEFELAMSKQKEGYEKVINVLKKGATINTNPQVEEEQEEKLNMSIAEQDRLFIKNSKK